MGELKTEYVGFRTTPRIKAMLGVEVKNRNIKDTKKRWSKGSLMELLIEGEHRKKQWSRQRRSL